MATLFDYIRIRKQLHGASIAYLRCPCGGTGRRAGFKIQFPLEVGVRFSSGAPFYF